MKCSDPGVPNVTYFNPLKRSGHTSLNDFKGQGGGPFLPRRRENHVWVSEVPPPCRRLSGCYPEMGRQHLSLLALPSAGAALTLTGGTSAHPYSNPSGGRGYSSFIGGNPRHCEIQYFETQ